MRSVMIALVAVYALALEGCSSPCTDMKAATDEFNRKACAGSTKQGFTKATCDQNVSKCTDKDDKVIRTYASCIDNLDTCTSENEGSWNIAALSCVVGLGGVSSGCAQAFK